MKTSAIIEILIVVTAVGFIVATLGFLSISLAIG